MRVTLNDSGLSALWEAAVAVNTPTVQIDLTPFRFITCEALVGLCALIEYSLSTLRRKCRIVFPELNIQGKNRYWTISRYINASDEVLASQLRKAKVDFFPGDLEDSRRIVRFFSYLHNLGFTELWNRNEVECAFFPRDQAHELIVYSGSHEDPTTFDEQVYRRYTKVKKLAGGPENRESTLKTLVIELLNNAPKTHKNSPLFEDKELEKVFLTQLAENVASHAKTAAYAMARTYSATDLHGMLFPKTVLPSCSAAAQGKCFENGFFDIVISDSGPGIASTLREAYLLLLKDIHNLSPKKLDRIIESPLLSQDVIQFSLDEFGSRYLRDDNKFRSLVDRHSLNQVFQYTRKYGGTIQIISDGVCLVFETCDKIERGSHGLGFKSSLRSGDWSQYGLLVRISLPHNPRSANNYPKARANAWPDTYPEEKIYPLFRHIGSAFNQKPTEEEVSEKAVEITHWALTKKIDQLALDFAGTEQWAAECFLIFLSKIDNLVPCNAYSCG